MPKIGAEPRRRKSLISAAIHLIGENGSLDVSVKEIATRAGMSSALAFHYFGGKDGIILETMRHLLREFAIETSHRLSGETDPRDRIEALIEASFAPGQFHRNTVAAWLVFYLHAYSSPQAARLLRIYTRRLHSNLLAPLRELMPEAEAIATAETLAALIDGVYIRHALRQAGPDSGEAIDLCRRMLQSNRHYRIQATLQ